MSAAHAARDMAASGPVSQSIRVGFRVLHLATLLLALGWAVSNVRQVPADSQAVVLRFGQVVRVQQAGLVLAWPRPFEQVDLLPGPDRQVEIKIEAGTGSAPGIDDPASIAGGLTAPASAGSYLTGDGGLVLLDATLTWRIADPRAYYLAAAHVAPALRRLFMAGAATVAAGKTMDDFMVVRPELAANDAAAQAQRAAIRGALAAEVNRRLAALERAGAGLGVEIMRADVTALVPPSAKSAFDAVLDAAQMVEQGLAAARTDATRTAQAADRDSDRVLAEAHAAAEEQVGAARGRVATIVALSEHMDAANRPNLLDQLYRERIAAILRAAGSVTTVDPAGGNRIILPGVQQ